MNSILTVLIFAILYIPCSSQSVVASAGQSGSNNSMQASATVGEAIIGSNSATGLSANQGFQQPLQSDLTTSIYNSQGQIVDVVLSPNPVADKVKLSFSQEVSDMQISIYTNTGSLAKTYQLEGPITVLEESLIELKSGIYYIYIVNKKGRQLGSMPLIKL